MAYHQRLNRTLSLDEFAKHYFPEDVKKYPIIMRVTKDEEQFIRKLRGEWTATPNTPEICL